MTPPVSCRNFESLCNDQLDARAAASHAVEAALTAHARACPRCRTVAARYALLAQALSARRPEPEVPDGFAERVLTIHAARSSRGRPAAAPWWRPTAAARWAAAAAAVLLLSLGVVALRTASRPDQAPAPEIAQSDPGPPALPAVRPLSDLLAEVTAASVELAREASAPAVRVGRGMLASAEAPGEAPPAPEPPLDLPSDLLHSVEEGMRPLSGSARHAFGFLLPSGLAIGKDPGGVGRMKDEG